MGSCCRPRCSVQLHTHAPTPIRTTWHLANWLLSCVLYVNPLPSFPFTLIPACVVSLMSRAPLQQVQVRRAAVNIEGLLAATWQRGSGCGCEIFAMLGNKVVLTRTRFSFQVGSSARVWLHRPNWSKLARLKWKNGNPSGRIPPSCFSFADSRLSLVEKRVRVVRRVVRRLRRCVLHACQLWLS